MVSLKAQSEDVCDVLARLETVTAIVKASVLVQDRNSTGVIRSYADSVNHIGEDEKENILGIGDCVKQASHFQNPNDNETAVVESNTCEYESLGLRTTDQEMVRIRSREDNKALSAEAIEMVSSNAGNVHEDCVDNVLSSTRPCLSRKFKLDMMDKKDTLLVCNTNSEHTVASDYMHKSVSPCPVPSSLKMSLPSSVTSGKTSSSMNISTTSLVNKVKEVCNIQDWKLEGIYSSRRGKEGCAAVHVYKLSVIGGVSDIVVRGVGESKREAVRGAFKTMNNRLEAVNIVNPEKEETAKSMQNKEHLCEDFVNFAYQEPLDTVKSESNSEDSLSTPPVFHAKDCIAGMEEKRSVVSHNDACASFGSTRSNIMRIISDSGATVNMQERVALSVSDYDAGAIIGRRGSKINTIIEITGASISVGGFVGGGTRMVDLCGEKNQVEEALRMIQKLIKK